MPHEDDVSAAPLPVEEGKIPQLAANYVSKGKGSEVCANCMNFEAPEACRVVEGRVEPGGHSDLFQAAGGMAQLMNEMPQGVL